VVDVVMEATAVEAKVEAELEVAAEATLQSLNLEVELKADEVKRVVVAAAASQMKLEVVEVM
jgi:hypothetical protein